jgi:hypothetical protein
MTDIPLPVPLAISPEANRKMGDAGVRRYIFGRMHGQNRMIQIAKGNYAGAPDAVAVARSPSPAIEPGDQLPEPD